VKTHKTLISLIVLSLVACATGRAHADLVIDIAPGPTSSQMQLTMTGRISVAPTNNCSSGAAGEKTSAEFSTFLNVDALGMRDFDSTFPCVIPNESFVILAPPAVHDFYDETAGPSSDSNPGFGTSTIPWVLDSWTGGSLRFKAYDIDGHNNDTIPTPTSISWNLTTTVDMSFQNFKTGSYTWGNTTDAISGNGVTLSVIPEPATMTLLALGGIALLRRRRRAVRVSDKGETGCV